MLRLGPHSIFFTQGLGRLAAGQMWLQRVKTGVGFQCVGLCLSDWKTCRHVQTSNVFFLYLWLIAKSVSFRHILWAAVPLIHCSLSLQHQGGVYPVKSRLPFPSNRKLYEIVVSYGREPCWQHVTTSERSKFPAPWLKVMLMLQLYFCSVSNFNQFYLHSFLPKAFKAFASIHFLDFLCCWILL